MTEPERRLLDAVFRIGQELTNDHVKALARYHQNQPLEIGYQIAIGQKFRRAGILPSLPKYAIAFLQRCIESSDRHANAEYCVDTDLVDGRRQVNQLMNLAHGLGLTARENRYLHHRSGIGGFDELAPVELAKREGVSSAYVCKVENRFMRKLQLAAVVSDLTRDEIKKILHIS